MATGREAENAVEEEDEDEEDDDLKEDEEDEEKAAFLRRGDQGASSASRGVRGAAVAVVAEYMMSSSTSSLSCQPTINTARNREMTNGQREHRIIMQSPTQVPRHLQPRIPRRDKLPFSRSRLHCWTGSRGQSARFRRTGST